MNKGLEALKRLVDGNLNEVNYYRQFCDSTTYIMKDKETIEKELKALEIILKEFRFTFDDEEQSVMIDNCYTVIFRNKKKYDLLKEVCYESSRHLSTRN